MVSAAITAPAGGQRCPRPPTEAPGRDREAGEGQHSDSVILSDRNSSFGASDSHLEITQWHSQKQVPDMRPHLVPAFPRYPR